MHHHMIDIRSYSGTRLGSLARVALAVVCAAVLLQCGGGDSGVHEANRSDLPRSEMHNGYAIPLFEAPDDQLRHARAWFSDTQEKRAALEVLIERFPDARSVRAEAELELAYLSLGADHRFATPTECRDAVDRYRQVLSDYADIPAICAKANWYIGWILADLLLEHRKAVPYFQAIVHRYPQAALNLKSPVPWVSLVLPQIAQRPHTVADQPDIYWAGIALLELVRIGEHEADRWSAFQKLYSEYPRSPATGFAMRELLNSSGSLARKAAPLAQAYLDAGFFSRPLAREIPGLLEKNRRLRPLVPPSRSREAR